MVLDTNDLLNNSWKTPFLSFLSNYQADNFYVILSQKKNTWKYIDFEWIPLNSTKLVKHNVFLKKNEKLFFCHQWILDRCDLGTPSNLYWHAVSETEAGSISYFETCTAMHDIKMARCWGISIRNFSTSEQGSRHVEIFLFRTSCGLCQHCQTW